MKIEELPKCIEVDDCLYTLRLHITAWDKLCLCYHAMFPRNKIDSRINILSQVVESDKENANFAYNLERSKNASWNKIDIDEIIDVPTFDDAINICFNRVNCGVFNGEIKIYKA